MLKVLICEDQLENANLLKEMLGEMEDVEVVGHAENGTAAISMVKKLSPDVVLMDIGLPGMDGLSATELIKSINPDIFIVVITAYTGYALDAYKLYVYDYILKPYDKVRIFKTLNNISKLKDIGKSGIELPAKKKKIVIKSRDEIVFLDQQEIVMVERDEAKCCIYTAKEVIETYDSLNTLEERLNKEMFFRSHRGFIVNLYYVDRIVNYGRKVYTIRLKYIEKEALISYNRISEIEDLISKNINS
jgi:two-component system LytT family response regulator